MKGLVLNIQKFSIDDGPGIRTTVFLKGCNLRCLWCHNPESIEPDFDIEYFPQKCIKCGKCAEACPTQSQRLEGEVRTFVRTSCIKCGKCAQLCCSDALKLEGKLMSAEEVLAEVEKDRSFYEKSNGGVTFSGGEPMLQKAYLKELLMESRSKGFHTAVDTAGNVPWDSFIEVLPYVDLFLFDLKAFDEVHHKTVTGVTNKRLLDNLKKLSETGAEIWVRIPVVPGINIIDNEAERLAEFLRGLGKIKVIELLPYHKLGESKYEGLDMDYRCKNCKTPDKEFMETLAEVFEKKGVETRK